MGYFGAVLGDAKQVFIQRLIEITRTTIGIGVELVAFGYFDAAWVFAGQTGIVVIGQHQAQPGDVHHIRVGEPITLAWLRAQSLQALRYTGGAFAPKLCGDGQTVRKLPIQRQVARITAGSTLIPPSVNALENVGQLTDLARMASVMSPGDRW